MKKPVLGLTYIILLTLVYGTIYATAQQSLRQGANDPQIELAEDTARLLQTSGKSPQELTAVHANVDIEKSLAPFVIVYNKDGRALATSGQLGASEPEVPAGVLRAATSDHRNQVTWQPRAGVRLAAVVVATGNNYVLSARSLREVEQRETTLELVVGVAWLLSLATVITSHLYLHKRTS